MLLKSHEHLQARLHEHETYDDKLKEQYLKKAVKEMQKMKAGIQKDQQNIRNQFAEDKEYYKVKLKTFETNQEALKQTMDLIKKKLQDLKFNNNGGSSSIAGGYSILSSIDSGNNNMFASTQEGGLLNSHRSNNYNNTTQNITIIGGMVNKKNSSTFTLDQQSIKTYLSQELNHLKTFLLSKLQSVLDTIEDVRRPINDQIQNLIKENEGFDRELDRYDALYRNMLNDYMATLEENKKLIEYQYQMQ